MGAANAQGLLSLMRCLAEHVALSRRVQAELGQLTGMLTMLQECCRCLKLMHSTLVALHLIITCRCDLSQAAAAGCSACACAAANSCTTQHLAVAAGCQGCRALGTDLCSRSSRQELLLPYTGLIESVLLALPAVLSLLQLVTPFRPALPLDCEAGSRRPIYKDGRYMARWVAVATCMSCTECVASVGLATVWLLANALHAQNLLGAIQLPAGTVCQHRGAATCSAPLHCLLHCGSHCSLNVWHQQQHSLVDWWHAAFPAQTRAIALAMPESASHHIPREALSVGCASSEGQ